LANFDRIVLGNLYEFMKCLLCGTSVGIII